MMDLGLTASPNEIFDFIQSLYAEISKKSTENFYRYFQRLKASDIFDILRERPKPTGQAVLGKNERYGKSLSRLWEGMENRMIRYADMQDLPVLKEHDRHISESELRNIIPAKRILVMYQEDIFVGWLRFGLFWDNIPFMNMLYILDGYRGKGNGTELVSFWEKEMAKKGYGQVLTSTQSDEQAQFFYRKIGYTECGALLLPKEPLEMFFLKKL